MKYASSKIPHFIRIGKMEQRNDLQQGSSLSGKGIINRLHPSLQNEKLSCGLIRAGSIVYKLKFVRH